MAMIPERYGFIDGILQTSKGERFTEDEFTKHLEHTVLPYSQASAYRCNGQAYMVGSLARMNLAKDRLHPKTQSEIASIIAKFPSTDIFYNNLAQAIEILHSIDDATEILTTRTFVSEPIIKVPMREGTGVGLVEAPRGILYHRVTLNTDGTVKEGEIVVPTGQNQINIECDVAALVQQMLPSDPTKEHMTTEIEKLIRAYDPCMSCASHFLKVSWQ